MKEKDEERRTRNEGRRAKDKGRKEFPGCARVTGRARGHERAVRGFTSCAGCARVSRPRTNGF